MVSIKATSIFKVCIYAILYLYDYILHEYETISVLCYIIGNTFVHFWLDSIFNMQMPSFDNMSLNDTSNNFE